MYIFNLNTVKSCEHSLLHYYEIIRYTVDPVNNATSGRGQFGCNKQLAALSVALLTGVY